MILHDPEAMKKLALTGLDNDVRKTLMWAADEIARLKSEMPEAPQWHAAVQLRKWRELAKSATTVCGPAAYKCPRCGTLFDHLGNELQKPDV